MVGICDPEARWGKDAMAHTWRFIRFLNAVECSVPTGRAIHAVLDKHAHTTTPKCWLARHSRWTSHFTPTSAYRLNAVENFCSKMTRQRIRRGIFRSIADPQAEINAYLAEHNASPSLRLGPIGRGRTGQTRPLPCTTCLIQCTSGISASDPMIRSKDVRLQQLRAPEFLFCSGGLRGSLSCTPSPGRSVVAPETLCAPRPPHRPI
jgi:hypothetical protein